VNWAKSPYRTSDLGGYDSLLAVSTTGRAYAFLVPTAVQGVSQSQVDNLMHRQIEPALRNGDWRGAGSIGKRSAPELLQFRAII
jgi:hypothetical protein